MFEIGCRDNETKHAKIGGINALFTPAEIENIEFTQFGYNLKKSGLGTLY